MTADQAGFPVSAEPRADQPSKLVQGVEVLVFLFLIGPSMVLSLFTIRQGRLSFPLVAIVVICRDLALVALILYFLWRNREPLARIGWTGRHAIRELSLGVAFFIPLCLAALLLEKGLLHLGLSGPKTSLPSFLEVHGRGEAVLGVALVSVVAVAEETIFRGYLLLRLPAVLRSTAAAVVLSSLIFAAGHGYEGSAGLATVGFMGLVFALIYVWRGSLLAPIVMHFLQDFLSIVLLPLLGVK